MIPKIIHYCWFGGNPMPEQYKKCMQSWKKYCPDYEIVEWNESNFDIAQNQYCSEAYAAKRWAFVSDYARLKIIYENGGIYLDTDVELVKDITPLVTDGVGFAAAPHNAVVKEMLDIYENRYFVRSDGTYNAIPCPAANTVGLIRCGLKVGKPWCTRIQDLQGIRVYPEEYFNPLDNDTQKLKLTENTYSIHQYAATWLGENYNIRRKVKQMFPATILRWRTEMIAKKHVKKIEDEISGVI